MKKIAILGSTGSIGTQTLSVVREHGDIEVTALAAGHNIAKLEEQIREFHPALVAVWAEEDAIELRTRVADLKVKVASLVTAGHIIMPLAKECNVKILPVDSEHSAIFQSLQGAGDNKIAKILLTASGGPFRGKKRAELEQVKVEDALKHPNWSMGRKITIDSATMINKGLEVIEAKWLFDVNADQIQVVVQPQSIIHSMV